MKAAILDFETTGLVLPLAALDKQPRAIEAGVILIGGEYDVVQELSLLINPQQSLSAEITKITGLSDADLAGAPRFEEILPQLRDIFSAASVLIAHNLNFDKSILSFELKRLGVDDFPWPARELCTVQAYREDWGRNPRLLELYEQSIGRPLKQTHRALDDARALYEIVRKEKLLEVYK